MDKNIWQRFVVTFFNQPWKKTTRSVDSISGGNHPVKLCLSPLLVPLPWYFFFFFCFFFFTSSNEEARVGEKHGGALASQRAVTRVLLISPRATIDGSTFRA